MSKRAFFALLFACVAGCSSSDETKDTGGHDVDGGVTAGDGGETDAMSISPTVAIGTGIDTFEPITEGELMTLTEGPQNAGQCSGYHIWSAVKARGVDPLVTLRFLILDATTREMRAQAERRLQLEPAGGDDYIAYGTAPRIDDCCLAEGRMLVMRVEVTEADSGAMYSDERTVLAGTCLTRTGVRVCDGAMTCP